MQSKNKLTIILPLYNPHMGWENELIHSLNQLQEKFSGVEYCVTMVNDGSSNDIGLFVNNNILPLYKNLNYLTYSENQGKGFAIRYGLEHSLSDYYIYTDFDFPFGFDSLLQTYNKLAGGDTNLVIGTRDYSYYKALPYKRAALSFSLTMVNFFITRFRVKDTQAGLKGLDNKARDIFLTTKTNSFVFELEFILKCLNSNLKHSFVHVVPNSDIRFSNFNSKTVNRELKSYFKIIFGLK